jgi:hypothetical protein
MKCLWLSSPALRGVSLIDIRASPLASGDGGVCGCVTCPCAAVPLPTNTDGFAFRVLVNLFSALSTDTRLRGGRANLESEESSSTLPPPPAPTEAPTCHDRGIA